MGAHYLDIETTGIDPTRDRIVTIQYQPVGKDFGAGGPLVILEAFDEEDEMAILDQFTDTDFWNHRDPWGFFPVGFNLSFEHRFLWYRSRANGIPDADVPWDFAFQKPSLDLQPLAILMNKGRHKGASLQNFSPKGASGDTVIRALAEGDRDTVRSYIKQETDAFFRLLQSAVRTLPRYWDRTLRPTLDSGLVADARESPAPATTK